MTASTAYRSVLHYESAELLKTALHVPSVETEQEGQLNTDPVDWHLSTYDRESYVQTNVEHEAQRLQVLKSFQILGTGREADFDRVTTEVRERFNVPWAVIAFVDLERVWIKSLSGDNMDVVDMARRDAFCSHTVMLKDGILAVQDLSEDVRFCDNPYVTGNPGFRFHAGAPLITAEGFKIGSICIFDKQPRTEPLTEEEEDFLQSMATSTVELLVTRKNKLESEAKRDRSTSLLSSDMPSSPTMKKVRSNPSLSELLSISAPLCSFNEKPEEQPPKEKKCTIRLLLDLSALNRPPTPTRRPSSPCDESTLPRIPKVILCPSIPDPRSCDVDPDQYLSDLLEATYGISPKITPALKLNGYFLKITEDQMAAYSMDIVSATRENNVDKLRNFVEERGPHCLDCYNRFGEGLLNMACRRGFKEIVKFLLSPEVKLNVRVRDDYGRTPLHDACWHPEPQLEICAWILEADPSLFLIADKRGFTPFQYARKSDWPVWRQFLYERRDQFQSLVQTEILEQFS